ncbi:MAG: polysaccharide deacetylase family protein [Flavobacteriales bacterium]|nr:polysaccharide deacetylase family protein [Flavobacteriales bacterium]
MPFAERYAEIKEYAPAGMRGRLRHAALTGMSSFYRWSGRMADALERPRVQFLYIHHTFSDELPALERLIAELGRTHTFIPYSEAVDRVLEARIDKPYLCISSDDGFRNNLDGGRILRDHGISACFFINPGLIALRDEKRIREICGERLHFPPVAFLGWDEVSALKAMGHEIGSHSWEHHRLARLGTEALAEDIARSRGTIVSHLGEAPHFAYPYGRFTDLPVEGFRAVFAAGHRSCASAERGCHVVDTPVPHDQLLIRRDHVVLDWPLDHVRYFLAANALKADPANNRYPART